MTVAAVSRCLNLLEILAGERDALELSELAARLDIPPSAAHRTITTLMNRGWAVQEPATQKYALSLRMSTLAFRNLDVRHVPDVVQAILNNLAARTKEYCRLAILEDQNLVWVARAQGAVTGLRYDPDMGQDVVLHATANGKAWLATLPEDDAISIVQARGFEADRELGPNSVTTVDQLRERLNETRTLGYGTSVEEAEAGTAALAVPYRCGPAKTDPIAGTLSIAGPLVRIHPGRWPELAAELHAAAEEVSQLWPLRMRQRDIADFSSGAKLDDAEVHS